MINRSSQHASHYSYSGRDLSRRKKRSVLYSLSPENFESAQQEIILWLEQHLPTSSFERMAPSEKSGYIAGYFGDLRIDFNDIDLQTFCRQWETPRGRSVDDRFQCFIQPYNKWLDQISQYTPLRTMPIEGGLVVWWDTPLGFIYHWIDNEIAIAQELTVHPLSPQDLWFKAVQLWPELSTLNSKELIYGHNYFDIDGVVNIIYDHDLLFDEIIFLPERRQALLAWFNLPPCTIFSECQW